jgi:hypothetical protein
MGPALAPGQPLLLTSIARSGRQKRLGRQRPGLFVRFQTIARRVHPVALAEKRNSPALGNHFRCGDLFLRHHVENEREAETVMDSPQIDRNTSRSICNAVGERLQRDLRPEASPLSPQLQHLMEELRRQDGEGPRRSCH